MPKSKRDRTGMNSIIDSISNPWNSFFFNLKVALTKTKKKGLEFKQSLINEIRECLDGYDNLFIISIFNQRNNHLKELRQQWSTSK